MIKVKNHICTKCRMEVELPDFDETRPVSEYFPKWERAVLKHGWQHHREDFPPQFKSFSKLMKWLITPEGKLWNRQQGKWRNKILNGLVTTYCRIENEHFLSG
ncbi:hypothetical protein ES705_42160 [subsurface metagenome]